MAQRKRRAKRGRPGASQMVRATRRRGRPSGLTKVSAVDLQRELERRQNAMRDLIRQRDALNTELQELESIFSTAPSRWSAPFRRQGRRRRALGAGRQSGRRNKNSLVEWLRRLLNRSTMSVSDAAAAVKGAGYKSKSSNFRVIVNQALLANPKIFRKVDRGRYTAK